MHKICIPHILCLALTEMVDGEEANNGTTHHSESEQLEKLLDDKKQHAALVSQTRVSTLFYSIG